MIKSITAGRTNITPSIAAEWLEKYEYPFQRDIRNVKVEQLSIAMRQGQFSGNTIKIAHLNGAGYCVNGQHTLLAIIDSDKTQNLTVEDYEIDSMDDAAHIYYTTDINQKRTLEDVYRTKNMRERTGFKGTTINSLGAAVRLVEGRFERHAAQLVTYDDLADRIFDWKPYADEYLDTITGCVLTTHKMTRKPIMAMGIATFKYIPEHARGFWHGVGFNDSIPDGDSRRTLHYYIMTNSVWAGAAETRLCRIIAKCLNSYIQNKPLSRIVTTATSEPVKVLGTELTI